MLQMQRLIVPILLGMGIVATLGREILFAKYLGVSRELEIFRLAFSLPNMMSQSLAAAYVGALMPMLVRSFDDGVDTASEFRKDAARVSGLGMISVTLLGVATAPLQAMVLAPGFETESRAGLTVSVQICWCFFLLMGMSFYPRLLLNFRDVFWPGSSASIVISCILAASVVLGSGYPASVVLSAAAVVAGAVVLVTHVARQPDAVRDFAAMLRRRAAGNGYGGAVVASLFSVLILHTVNSLPRFVDRAVASQQGEGAVAAMDFSFNIITVPGILLATSVITVFYPAYAKAVHSESDRGLPPVLTFAAVAAISLAAIAGWYLSVYSREVIEVVYGRGQFEAAAIAMTATLLYWHAIALGFMVASLILMQACVAYEAYKFLLVVVVVRLVSKLVAVKVLVPQFGLDGLAASFLVPEVTSTVLLAMLAVYLYRKGTG